MFAVVEQCGIAIVGALGDGEKMVGGPGVAEPELDESTLERVARPGAPSFGVPRRLLRPELCRGGWQASLTKGGTAGGTRGQGGQEGSREPAELEKPGHGRGIGRLPCGLRPFFRALAVPGSGDLLIAPRP
jgi:hypothetical protein